MDQEVYEILCENINAIKTLSEAFATISGNIKVDKDSINQNLEDISEGEIDEQNIYSLLLFCESRTKRIEICLNLQKDLNDEIRRKIQDSIAWL